MEIVIPIAFGRYSMGGVTTGDVLAYQFQYFKYFMPMAGDSWIDQVNEGNVDDLLKKRLAATWLYLR